MVRPAGFQAVVTLWVPEKNRVTLFGPTLHELKVKKKGQFKKKLRETANKHMLKELK